MQIREVRLPGPIVVVPSAKLEARVRQQARDHPYLPVDLSRIAADLDARTDGAAVTVERPRGSGDPSLLVHARHYVLRLFPARSGRAYVIAAVTPLDLRDHHRLAQGCLLVRPARWQVAYELRSVPSGVSAYWDRLQWEWGELAADLPPAQVLSRSHADYLDRLDRMIDATQKLTTEAARPARPFAYVERSATAERRQGVHAVYEFRLGSATAPEEGAFVQVRGEPGQRGQVTRVAGAAVTVRFDQPVDWSNLAPQGELELTASTVVFDKQREAVDLLRSGRAPGSRLLPALVDHQLAPVRHVEVPLRLGELGVVGGQRGREPPAARRPLREPAFQQHAGPQTQEIRTCPCDELLPPRPQPPQRLLVGPPLVLVPAQLSQRRVQPGNRGSAVGPLVGGQLRLDPSAPGHCLSQAGHPAAGLDGPRRHLL